MRGLAGLRRRGKVGDARGFSAPAAACATHFALVAAYLQKSGLANDRMGVNMRLFNCGALAGVKLHYPDGRAWDGTGAWGYVREAVVL